LYRLKTVSVVGSSPEGLMAAYELADAGFKLTIFDHKNRSPENYSQREKGDLILPTANRSKISQEI